MMKWLFLTFCCLLFCELRGETDSAQFYFEGAKGVMVEDPALALDMVEKASKISHASKNLLEFGKALFLKGYIHQRQDNHYEALKAYYEALMSFKRIDDQKRVSDVLFNIGIVFFESYAYDKAIQSYLESAKIKIKLDERFFLAQLYRNIGMALRYREEYDSAIVFHKKALQYYDYEQERKISFINIQ